MGPVSVGLCGQREGTAPVIQLSRWVGRPRVCWSGLGAGAHEDFGSLAGGAAGARVCTCSGGQVQPSCGVTDLATEGAGGGLSSRQHRPVWGCHGTILVALWPGTHLGGPSPGPAFSMGGVWVGGTQVVCAAQSEDGPGWASGFHLAGTAGAEGCELWSLYPHSHHLPGGHWLMGHKRHSVPKKKDPLCG